MAYIDVQESGGRTRAIAGVAIVHGVLGYALVVGLATGFSTVEMEDDVIGFFVPTPTIEPPPPPQPKATTAEPAESIIAVPTPRMTPLSPPSAPVGTIEGPDLGGIVVRDPGSGVGTGVGTGDGTVVRATPSPRPSVTATPAPPPPDTAVRPRNADWVTTQDYRPAWIRRELEGTVGFALTVGANGRVESCAVTASSGHAPLDGATCALVTQRARFDPAKSGRTGKPVPGRYSGRVQWVLPE